MASDNAGAMRLTCSPTQLTGLLARYIPARRNVLITGRPGIGKSEIVEAAAADAGTDLIISHAVTSDATDYKGLPWMFEGEAQWLPYGDLKRMMTADRPLTVFFDDVGQAAPSVQAALMQVTQARRVNDHLISDHVSFVLATNRKEDAAAVTGMIEPLKSRTTIFELEPSLDDWSRWALDAGLPVSIIGYARTAPQCILDWKPTRDITNTPCPRTMAAAGKTLAMGLPDDLLLRALAGEIGTGHAAQLMAYHKSIDGLPSLDSILTNPRTAAVPSRSDQLFMVIGGLARRCTANNIPAVLLYGDRLPPEYQASLIVEIRHANAAARKKDSTIADVSNTRAMIDWEVAHHSLLA